MDEFERTIEKQRVKIEKLNTMIKKLDHKLENFEGVLVVIKCRDCLFKTNDLLKMQEHAETLEHSDYSLMKGGKVIVDWIRLEVKRKEPESV